MNSDPLDFFGYPWQFLKYKFRIFDSAPHSVLTIWHTQKFSALNNLNDEQIKIVPKTTELDRKLKQYFIIDLWDTVDCGRLLCPACRAGRFWVFLNFQNCSSLTFLSSSFSFFYSDPCPGLGAGASSLALSFYPEILHMSVCSPIAILLLKFADPQGAVTCNCHEAVPLPKKPPTANL